MQSSLQRAHTRLAKTHTVATSESYTETGHQAGQVDVAWCEHVQLLEARDGGRLHQRVGVILHDGAADQTRRADGRDSHTVTCAQRNTAKGGGISEPLKKKRNL